MGKKEPVWIVGGKVNDAAIIENSMVVPQKSENRTIMWSSNAASEYLSKGIAMRISKRCVWPCSL